MFPISVSVFSELTEIKRAELVRVLHCESVLSRNTVACIGTMLCIRHLYWEKLHRAAFPSSMSWLSGVLNWCPSSHTKLISPAQLAHANFPAVGWMRMDGCGRRFNETLAEVENDLVREDSVRPASAGPLAQLWPCRLCGVRASCHFCCGVDVKLRSSLRRTRVTFLFFTAYGGILKEIISPSVQQTY